MNNNEASAQPRAHIHDALELSHQVIYRHSYAHGLIPGDSGICDGMNNCHLTEPWAGFVNQQINLSITQITSEIPILNPYESMRPSMHARGDGDIDIHESIYAQRQTLRPRDHRRYELLTPCHTQQQLFSGGFSRLDELHSGKTSTQFQLRVPMTPTANISESREERVKSCIKFQDRNKKLDFKMNFREENRKLNRCFHRDGSKSPRLSSDNNKSSQCTSSDNVAHPPKKKWIRHWTGLAKTGKFGFEFGFVKSFRYNLEFALSSCNLKSKIECETSTNDVSFQGCSKNKGRDIEDVWWRREETVGGFRIPPFIADVFCGWALCLSTQLESYASAC